MIQGLPSDIIDLIIDKLFLKYHPIELLQLRNINCEFRLKIDNKKIPSKLIHEDGETRMKIDSLLRRNTNINQIEWLMNNHVEFSLSHIRTIIIHNRIDIIKKGFYYENFLKLIFNRFYFNEEDNEPSVIYAAYECNNPIIIASKYNRVDIVRLLIESSSHGNPYTKVLNGILDIAVKYSHKNLFCYLVTYQYESIQQLVTSKIGKIINRLTDCEDIFFYLILNNKIEISVKVLLGCIVNNYYELFIYIYPQLHVKDRLELLLKTIDMNNYELFNYILSECSSSNYEISTEHFTEIIISNHKYTIEFLLNIINNHIHRIIKDSKFIYICLENNINDQIIKDLIHLGYSYDDDDMQFALSNKKISLLRDMCNSYNRKDQ